MFFLSVFSLLLLLPVVEGDKCAECRLLADTFRNGLKMTEKMHFTGGNTDWEERNLGKFALSETRLVEVLERVCKKGEKGQEGLLDTLDMGKDDEHRCQMLLEEHEELLENWYFHKQTSEPDLHGWLCIDTLRLCCPLTAFGPDCTPCPGTELNSIRPCFGRGQCDGDGTRGGSGKCKCDDGYLGAVCRKCAANYYIALHNDTFVDCRKCDDACKGGCKSGGAAGCHDCRPGWTMDGINGCVDVDECEDDPCDADNEEMCVNLVGSHECRCRDGYKRVDGRCEVDVIAAPIGGWWSPERYLRLASLIGLLIAFVAIAQQRSTALFFVFLFVIGILLCIEFGPIGSFLSNLFTNDGAKSRAGEMEL